MKTPHFHELDTVVLLRDVPEAGLRAGDLGAVVLVYDAEALEWSSSPHQVAPRRS